jgi:hypothetical protein
MLLTLVQYLLTSVLEIGAATLLLIAFALLIVVFAALVSETACRRSIRLINALAKLTNKDLQERGQAEIE